MTWTLLIIVMGGSVVSTNSTFATVPMKDRAACVSAADKMASESRGSIGFACISSETGEVYRAKQHK